MICHTYYDIEDNKTYKSLYPLKGNNLNWLLFLSIQPWKQSLNYKNNFTF